MNAIVRLLICFLLLTISFGAPSALAVNKVLSLDGDGDYVEIVDSDTLNNLSSQITIEAWIKATAYPNEWMPILYKGDNRDPSCCSNRSYTLWLNRSGSLHLASAPSDAEQRTADSPRLINLNAWHHIVGIIDAQNGVMKIFIDDSEVDSREIEGDIRVSHLPLRIGWTHEEDPSYAPFAGQIDEVRIWNVARTQEEIRADINQPIENPELLPNLVGYWNFEDGTVDLSQYGNDGTLQGDATIVESERTKVIFVPADYPTIQAGIDASNPGDTVIVDPGTYYENITLKSGITLKGAGADVTIIDGGDNGSVVKMSGISDVTISGFTITNGLGDGQDYNGNDNGGGIAVYECSNITIRDNVITQNSTTGDLADGGGILISKCTAPITIWQNSITDNHAENWGGGICIQGTFDVRVDANDISNNDAGVGDGISLWASDPADGASAWIINNWITNNQGDGIYVGDDCSALIGGNRDEANDIFGNTEYAVRNESTNDINATYNYWGTTVEQEIRDAIWDYYDDDSNGGVFYEPWIDGAHKKVFPFAQALNLDGDGDYVRIGNDPILAPDNFTIEAWFNPDDIRSCHIISRFEDTAQSYEIYLPGDGTVVYQVVGPSGWNNGRFHAGRITTNQWQHVAMTYDGSIIKGYLNGAKVGEFGFSEEMNKPDIPLLIGASRDGGSYFFSGLIDEVRIWNVARTQEDIQATMNTTLQGDETGLVGYWNFDDGTANDSSLHSGNHGMLQGDAEIVPLYGTWPPPKIGDVSGNGEITAHDAHLILKYVVGLVDDFPVASMASPSTVEPHDYELSLPEMEISPGKKIQVPIAINDATGLSAGGITIKYDTMVLRAIGYGSLELLNGYYWKANTDLTSEVRFAFATTEPTSGRGNLLMVEFEVLPGTEGRTSPLILDNVNLSNSRIITKTNGEVRVIPSNFALLQNYPNPFNPETWLPYKLAQDAPVTISVYNARGQLVRLINLGTQRAGVYLSKDKAAYWNGRNSLGEKAASGVYFYTLQAGKFTTTRRMLIIK